MNFVEGILFETFDSLLKKDQRAKNKRVKEVILDSQPFKG